MPTCTSMFSNTSFELSTCFPHVAVREQIDSDDEEILVLKVSYQIIQILNMNHTLPAKLALKTTAMTMMEKQ